MTKRIGGSRRKSRHKVRKPLRKKGKISISRYMHEFKIGDKVLLSSEPAVQKGMYPLRFHSMIADVIEVNNSCCTVAMKDKGKEKKLIVHPVHLKVVENGQA